MSVQSTSQMHPPQWNKHRAVDEGQRRADGVRFIIVPGAKAAFVEVVPHEPPTFEILVGLLDPTHKEQTRWSAVARCKHRRNMGVTPLDIALNRDRNASKRGLTRLLKTPQRVLCLRLHEPLVPTLPVKCRDTKK